MLNKVSAGTPILVASSSRIFERLPRLIAIRIAASVKGGLRPSRGEGIARDIWRTESPRQISHSWNKNVSENGDKDDAGNDTKNVTEKDDENPDNDDAKPPVTPSEPAPPKRRHRFL